MQTLDFIKYWVSTIGVLLLVLPIVVAVFGGSALLWIGGRFIAKSPRATYWWSLATYLLAALVGGLLSLIPFVGGVIALFAVWYTISAMFRVSYGKAILAWLPTLGTVVLMLPFFIPVIREVMRQSALAETRKLMQTLTEGAMQYSNDMRYRYVPGQQYPDRLGSEEGKETGSQMLARALFSDRNGAFPVSYYATCDSGSLFTCQGRPNTLSDGMSDPLPVCYYPACVGMLFPECFREEDNAAYTNGHSGGQFLEFIRSHESQICRSRFLLIAPGKDRKYFTDDDLIVGGP